MKKEKIKALAERVGQSRAERFWALFVERLCDGIEPEVGDTFKREDIEKRFENNPVARDAFVAVFCGDQKETPKPTALKEKHRETLDTAVLFAEYLKGSCPAWITAELIDRSKGQACLFLRDDNKPYEEESVKWIDWIRSGMPLAEGMKIDRKYRKPVRIGDEKPAQRLPVDPFPVGMRGIAPLTMPDYQSRCGASLAIKNDKGETVCVAGDVLSFLRLVDKYESPSQREQRDACEMAKVGGMEALKKTWPKASNAWDVGERPESAVPAVPFAEPPASTTAPRGGDVAPAGAVRSGQRIYVAGAEEAGPMWAALRTAMAPLERQGVKIDDYCLPGYAIAKWRSDSAKNAHAILALLTPAFVASAHFAEVDAMAGAGRPVIPVFLRSSDLTDTVLDGRRGVPATAVAACSDKDDAYAEIVSVIRGVLASGAPAKPTWTTETLRAVHAAIINRGLDRNTLLAGIPRSLGSSLPRTTDASAQVMLDLNHLPKVLSDGSNPLREYIANAAHLSRGQREEIVFREAMAALG